MNPRLEVSPELESGRYWVQLTLKYHRCGSVRDDGTRCVSGGVLLQGKERQGTKGLANFMDS